MHLKCSTICLSISCICIGAGALLGTYEDNRFKSESKKLPALKYKEDVCSGVILGKELVNAPPNVLTPG